MKISLKNIVSPTKTSKKTTLSEDHIEIIPKYIGIYHGCWIKYSSKEDDSLHQGGFLIDVVDDIVILRNIRRDIFEIKLYENIFYVKQEVPQHKAVKEIVRQKEQLSFDITAFNIERQKFLKSRKKILFS